MASAGRIKAGVIGLGSMGLGMAQSLAKRGIDVAGFDLDRVATDKLAASGGRVAESAADALADAFQPARCDIAVESLLANLHAHPERERGACRRACRREERHDPGQPAEAGDALTLLLHQASGLKARGR